MFCIPQEVNTAYDAVLVQNNVPIQQHYSYKKWLRYYWDFCHKYHHNPFMSASLPLFLGSLIITMTHNFSCYKNVRLFWLKYSIKSTDYFI